MKFWVPGEKRPNGEQDPPNAGGPTSPTRPPRAPSSENFSKIHVGPSAQAPLPNYPSETVPPGNFGENSPPILPDVNTPPPPLPTLPSGAPQGVAGAVAHGTTIAEARIRMAFPAIGEDVKDVVQALALRGDMAAARLFLAITTPGIKAELRPVLLPELETASGTKDAVTAIRRAIAVGQISPTAGRELYAGEYTAMQIENAYQFKDEIRVLKQMFLEATSGNARTFDGVVHEAEIVNPDDEEPGDQGPDGGGTPPPGPAGGPDGGRFFVPGGKVRAPGGIVGKEANAATDALGSEGAGTAAQQATRTTLKGRSGSAGETRTDVSAKEGGGRDVVPVPSVEHLALVRGEDGRERYVDRKGRPQACRLSLWGPHAIRARERARKWGLVHDTDEDGLIEFKVPELS